jgi:tetratricopeptide (TPR) repeat protein
MPSVQKIISILLIAASLHASAQPDSARRLYLQALDNFQHKDYPSFYLNIKKAHELHPYHQGILYQLGIASTLAGKRKEAISYLRHAIQINADFELQNNSALEKLKSRDDFKELLRLQSELKLPVVHSDTAFILHDRQLHPEGIAYDPRTRNFFATSVHKRKIVSIDSSGNVTDFTLAAANGIGAVLGLRVDDKSRLLWACSSAIPEMQDYDSTLPSAVFKFDIDSKTLLKNLSFLILTRHRYSEISY